jgi:hypothetical protein
MLLALVFAKTCSVELTCLGCSLVRTNIQSLSGGYTLSFLDTNLSIINSKYQSYTEKFSNLYFLAPNELKGSGTNMLTTSRRILCVTG